LVDKSSNMFPDLLDQFLLIVAQKIYF